MKVLLIIEKNEKKSKKYRKNEVCLVIPTHVFTNFHTKVRAILHFKSFYQKQSIKFQNSTLDGGTISPLQQIGNR